MIRLERLVLSALLAARRLRSRWRGEKRPLRVAGLMAVRDYSDATSAFTALRELADIVIVLDDNSTSPFPFRAECDEYLRLDSRGPWNDQANRTLLLYRAFVHGCDWVVYSEDDLAFGASFQTREDVARVVGELEAAGLESYRFALRELWESDDRYRVDGVWGQKSMAVLRKNWFAYPGITLKEPGLRLHTAAFPANLRIRQRHDDRNVAYHTSCRTRADRLARVEVYRREDPERRFQGDYDYMLDDRGIELAEVPEDDLRVLRRRLRLAPGLP